MAEEFIGEIKMFAFDFTPKNYAQCDGSIKQISGNQALASLLGNMFGGDGQTTFGLPDLRGRTPLLSSRFPKGTKLGEEYVTLTTSNIPSHTHEVLINSNPSTTPSVTKAMPQNGSILCNNLNNDNKVFKVTSDGTKPDTLLSPNNSFGMTGGGKAHPNMMPSLVINFCISLAGYYPPRDY